MPGAVGDVVLVKIYYPEYISGVRTALVEHVLYPIHADETPTLVISVEYGKTLSIQTTANQCDVLAVR
jgi:hypothetical protein